jgi:hypothetical protein
MDMYGGSLFFFAFFPILFFIAFFLIIGLIIYRFVSVERDRRRNNNSPVLTVNASVVTKRTDISNYHNHSMNSVDHMNSSTSYYTTFQVESGDRMELSLSGNDFGMLVEGDSGRLTFQGTRFLRFDRE